jgi:hypothetical protein
MSPIPSETSFGVWTDEDVNLTEKGERINTDKIKPGEARNWEAEHKVVQATLKLIVARVVERLIEFDMLNLGITAQAADAGRLEITGKLTSRPGAIVPQFTKILTLARSRPSANLHADRLSIPDVPLDRPRSS